MRKLKEIIRLQHSGLSQHQISRSLNVSVGAVNKYLKLAGSAGVVWPLPEELGDKDIMALIKPSNKCTSFTTPDYKDIHEEMKHKSVTLQLLHAEYCQRYPESHYSYRQFCALYRKWKRQHTLSLRQTHKGGEKLFTDYAGQTVPVVVNRNTGEVRESQIFVGVLGASSFTYAEATWSQSLENWIGSHTRAFAYFGGVPHLIVPDNLKAAIHQPCKYDPDTNPAYAAMADYYNTAILPARPYKPKDKSKVENGVLLVERWILAKLRHRTFYSIGELNQAIKHLLEDLNTRPFKKIKGCRKELFQKVERPALKPLPQKPHTFAKFYHRKVTPDYHIQHEEHYYSVPNSYAGQAVDIRVTERMIEIFCDGKRIACHQRHHTAGKTTLAEHMPMRHRQYVEWTLDKALRWSRSIGQSTQAFVEHISKKKKHTDQLTRFCRGMSRLATHFGEERLEAACKRALYYQAYSYKHLLHILEKGLDREEIPDLSAPPLHPVHHKNIRGAAYYH